MPNIDQWRLVYPGTDYTFGTPATPTYNVTAPDLGDAALRTEDTSRPRQDGTAVGVDYRDGRVITFDLGVYGATETEARFAESELSRAWRADAIRRQPGVVAELQANAGRGNRSVFGRPRRYAPNYQFAKQGLIFVTADFQCVDDLWYDSTQQTVVVGLPASTGGGLLAPLASPLTSSADSDRSLLGLTFGGEVPAWPQINFEAGGGAWTNPTLNIPGVGKVSLAMTIPANSSVTIDARPWVRRVYTPENASVAGSLTRDSLRLSAMAIPAGTYELNISGTSPFGASRVAITWRDIFHTL